MEFKFKDAVDFFNGNEIEKAQSVCTEIIRKQPDHFDCLRLLNMIYYINKDFTKALKFINKAIRINPNYAEAYNEKGNALSELKQLNAAIKNYDRAIEINPNYDNAFYNRGFVLQELLKLDDAVKSYDAVIKINPNYVQAYNNRGTALRELKKYDTALESYKKAFEIKPDLDFLLGQLIHTANRICNWNSFNKNVKILKDKILNKKNVTFPFLTLSLYDSPILQKISAETFVSEKFQKKILGTITKIKSVKKIRIGYYSADFRNHAMSFLLANLYELHDKSKFELIAFSFGPEKKDEMYYRISAAFDQFINVRLKSDDDVIKLSRELKIDIAVDLMAFTQYHRFGIFTKRCAPIQVNYLGYPGTSGAKCFDYIIADKTIIPEKNQKYYSEKIVYMPDTYQVNDSTKKISDKVFTREELGLPKEGFVFCCFNQSSKLNPEIFDIWMNLLKSINNSGLWILPQNKTAAKNLQKEAALRNVNPKRIIFAQRMKMSDHLARHKAADLFIDTFPYTAHTTASDALWAGLPVLTRIGESFASRVAASLLNAIELPELVTYTKKEYENKAIELANNPNTLKEIKNKLNKNRHTKPLFNTKLFTNNLEMAYLKIYEKYVNNKKPDNIEIK